MRANYLIITIMFFVMCSISAVSCNGEEPFNLTRAQVIKKTLKPYSGTSVKGVDTSTMTGKVLPLHLLASSARGSDAA